MKSYAWIIPLLVLAVCFGGCQKAEAPAPPASAVKAPPPPPPPPPPPDTLLGKLTVVERSAETQVQPLCLSIPLGGGGGSQTSCKPRAEKARKGKTFVVLHFEGTPPKPLPRLVAYRSVTSSGASVQFEERAWLTDAAGKKYPYGVFVKNDKGRQLSYEVPLDAAGLVWHADKQHFQLEPHPAAVAEAATPALPVKR